MAWSLKLLLLVAVGLGIGAGEKRDVNEPVALFEGHLLDLSEDWDEAEACLFWPEELTTIECFRSERELDERLDRLMGRNESGAVLASCTTSLRLYDLTSYGTPVVVIAGTSGWLNLSALGFNNKTSSYRVGSCNAIFADGTFGGNPWYATSLTTAGSQSPSMASGWNNRVSSVRYP